MDVVILEHVKDSYIFVFVVEIGPKRILPTLSLLAWLVLFFQKIDPLDYRYFLPQ